MILELLKEIVRREKEAGTYPNADADFFMKVAWTLMYLEKNCVDQVGVILFLLLFFDL